MSTALWNQERPWRAPGGPCGTTASAASHATAVVIIRRLIPATLQSTTGGASSRVRFGRRISEACYAPLRARRTASRSNSVAPARVRPYAHRGRHQPCAAHSLAPAREEGREGFDWGSMAEASRRPTDLSAYSAWRGPRRTWPRVRSWPARWWISEKQPRISRQCLEGGIENGFRGVGGAR